MQAARSASLSRTATPPASRSAMPAPSQASGRVRCQAHSAGLHSGEWLLVTTPVSNHAARVRFLIDKKGLNDLIKYVTPAQFGGLKSEEYLRINPQGKFPTLILPDGSNLPESEVIVQYLLDKFKGTGPDLQASTPEWRAIGNLVTRIHDIYIASVQACMYRAYPSAEQRVKDLETLSRQLDVIEETMVGRPFMAGTEITTADAAIFPTVVFMLRTLPKYFEWNDVFEGRPKLRAWWAAVNEDPVAKKVIAEVDGGIDEWEKADRWNQLGIVEQVAQNKHLFAQPAAARN